MIHLHTKRRTCATLQEDRELIAEVAKTDDWPISKDMLIKKHYKAFAKFTKKMDKIKEINTWKGTKHQEYSNKRGGDRRTNIVFFNIYNEGTIIVNTKCKKHVVLN